MIKIRAKEYTLDYLLNLREKHEKMENLHYGDLEMQNYLKDAEIPVAEAKNLFRFRTRIAKFKANMKNGYSSVACPPPNVQVFLGKNSWWGYEKR